MKKNAKRVAAGLLTSTLLVSCITPAFSQSYQPKYNNYQPTYNQGYQQPSYGNYAPVNNYMPPLQGRVVIPAGTSLPATLSTSLTSQYARIGDLVTATLGADMGGLPVGTSIQGRVVDAQPARWGNRNGLLNVRFDSAIAPSGKRYNISGKVSTQDGTGIIYGGTMLSSMGKVVKNAAIGSAVGAVSGVALGGITGKPGRGTWAGTAIGGGTGFLSGLFTKGQEAFVPPNTKIDILLDQAVQEGY